MAVPADLDRAEWAALEADRIRADLPGLVNAVGRWLGSERGEQFDPFLGLALKQMMKDYAHAFQGAPVVIDAEALSMAASSAPFMVHDVPASPPESSGILFLPQELPPMPRRWPWAKRQKFVALGWIEFESAGCLCIFWTAPNRRGNLRPSGTGNPTDGASAPLRPTIFAYLYRDRPLQDLYVGSAEVPGYVRAMVAALVAVWRAWSSGDLNLSSTRHRHTRRLSTAG